MTDVAVQVFAPAKVNLTLEVLGQRQDGYHEVASLMQTISLGDRLRLEPATRIELEIRGEQVAGVPLEGPENLAFKAALVLHEQAKVDAGVRITIEKEIPVGMGLGGGSTDAAAVLRGLNRLWSLDLSEERLAEVAALVGSDVPFFVYGGTAVVRGRGELVQPLPDHPERAVTLFTAPHELHQKTRLMYSLLTPAAFTDGRRTHIGETMVGRGVGLTEPDLYNAFDDYIGQAAPEIGQAMRHCRAMGLPVWVCGSGPGFFAMQALSDLPPLLAREMAAFGLRLTSARFFGREEAVQLEEV